MALKKYFTEEERQAGLRRSANKYRENNKERYNLKRKEYFEKNKEKISTRQKVYYSKNKEKQALNSKKWYSDPDNLLKRRESRYNTINFSELKEKQNNKCSLCEKEFITYTNAEIDHD